MIPNPYALRLQPLVEDMLSSVDGLISESRLFDPATSARHFTIGSSDYITVVLLRDMLADLAVSSPKLIYSIIPPSDNLVPLLDRGEIDLTITHEENLSGDHPARRSAIADVRPPMPPPIMRMFNAPKAAGSPRWQSGAHPTRYTRGSCKSVKPIVSIIKYLQHG